MHISEEYIRAFPEYEEVFAEDIERHRRHFLPFCSINLKCLFPEKDQWVHFVSFKEIYEGNVGQMTSSFHTEWLREDTVAFDVIGGKYKFAGDWNYFLIEQEEQVNTEYDRLKAAGDKQYLKLKKVKNQIDALKTVYTENEQDYEARKQFYKQHQKVHPYSSDEPMQSVQEVVDSMQSYWDKGWGIDYPEINGLLDDLDLRSEHMQKMFLEHSDSEEEYRTFESTNLLYVPQRPDGSVFPYIGALTGYYFQAYGADGLYLFYEESLQKAVICLEYT